MSQDTRPWNDTTNFLIRFLLICTGFILGLAGTAAGFYALYLKDSKGFALIVGGWLAAALPWALAKILHSQGVQIRLAERSAAAQEQSSTALAGLDQSLRTLPAGLPAAWPAPAAPPIIAPPPSLELASAPAADQPSALANPETTQLLEQLRDLAMMTEPQRQTYALRHWERRRDALVEIIEREILLSQWASASQHVADIRLMLPDDPIAPTLAARIEKEQSARLHQDLESARTQLQHLMSIASWDQAQEVIDHLQSRYANQPDVQAIAAEFLRERTTFERENYERLMADLKEATDHKHWRRAIMAAEELIHRYPNDPKINKLNSDLPKLRENADAHERREEEALFKDLLHRQRYEEAAVVAKRVIDKYPTSNTATELSKLLPKVEELIRQEKIKRQAGAPPVA